LQRLDGHAVVPEPADPVAALLGENHLLVDQQTLAAGVPAAEGLARHGHAALTRRLGDDAPASLASRGRRAVQVTTFGHPSADVLSSELRRLVQVGGLATGRSGGRRRSAPAAVPVAAVVGIGEPDRSVLDCFVGDGTPHLLVRMTEGRAVVGPFVVPTKTACLRCIDAHCTDSDPAWPLLVAQYASAAASDRRDGATEPVDPLLATLALSWAARDLATYAEGGRPSTWSATVTLEPDLHALETRCWLRHPGCGCSWV
jgi:bacteriocin biosynthesis cyclodehydratase domain-containing protein